MFTLSQPLKMRAVTLLNLESQEMNGFNICRISRFVSGHHEAVGGHSSICTLLSRSQRLACRAGVERFVVCGFGSSNILVVRKRPFGTKTHQFRSIYAPVNERYALISLSIRNG